MRWLLPILILLVGAAGFAGLLQSKPTADPLIIEEKVWIVAVETVSPGTITPTLTLYGRTESPRVARLSAAVTADVNAVYVLEGESVDSEQVLLSLDDRETTLTVRQREAEVAEIHAQIASERSRHENDQSALEQEQRLLDLSLKAVQRAKDLARTNVGSQAQLDDARQDEVRQILALDNRKLSIREFHSRIAQFEARLARAEAARDRAVLDLSRSAVRSPFTGRVSKVLVSPGDRVRSGDELVRLYDTSAIEVRAQIPIRYLPDVGEGLEAKMSLKALAEVDRLAVTLVLDRLTGEVTPGSGGVDGLFRIVEGGARLQLGRTIELVMQLPSQEAVVALPLEAVYGTNRIFKLADDRMLGVQVRRMGELRDASGRTRVLVTSPELRSGDQVIVTQLPNAIDGLRVRVVGGRESGAGQRDSL